MIGWKNNSCSDKRMADQPKNALCIGQQLLALAKITPARVVMRRSESTPKESRPNNFNGIVANFRLPPRITSPYGNT